MGKGREISPEESELFRRSIGEIRPIRDDSAERAKPKPPPRAEFRAADDREALRESLEPPDPAELESGEELLFRRDGVPRRVMTRLRRGRIPVRDHLDLHGMNRRTAGRLLAEFLQEAGALGHDCVRIVHGKGLRSGNQGPVLKQQLNHWLRRREEVLAFCSALPRDGGTGAVYVLLKS